MVARSAAANKLSETTISCQVVGRPFRFGKAYRLKIARNWWTIHAAKGRPLEHITRAFDPENTQSLCIAFDKVYSTIAERNRSEFVKELIARRVIALAERGERDPDRLAEATTASLGLH